MRGAEWEPVENLLQIGAADAAGVYPDQHLAGPDIWHRHCLHPDIIDAAVDCRLHGAWNRMRGVFDRVLSGYPHELILDDHTSGLASKHVDGRRCPARICGYSDNGCRFHWGRPFPIRNLFFAVFRAILRKT